MKYEVIITENFENEAKRLLKKYASLKNELEELEQKLISRSIVGTPIGNNVFKIRIAVKSKGKGKRGGLRIITYLEIDLYIDELINIFLLSIFDKSETENITKEELKRLISGRLRKK